MREYGLYEERESVKEWYDGFIFGRKRDIYNPWSIIQYLKERQFSTYWANTSGNSLVGKLVREGSVDVKVTMEDLLEGKTLHTKIDEQIVYSQLNGNENAIWSLLLASGYLRVESSELREGEREYELKLTNKEVTIMFKKVIGGWFETSTSAYNSFIKALLLGDVEVMNDYMNVVASTMFSYFDTGNGSTQEMKAERFYHGFVLGMMVELANRYKITSNRESGFGRYDVMLEPKRAGDDAIIIEFKVCKAARGQTLTEAVEEALKQIEEKNYAASLEAAGFEAGRIRKYGFAFEGKKVLIGECS